MVHSLCFRTRIVTLSEPIVMGIVNVTPDSFASHCSTLDEEGVLSLCRAQIEAGADLLDIGACSTRPHSVAVDDEEEWRRLELALRVVKAAYPQVVVSVDTFRASIAQKAIERYAVDMINDISGGADREMTEVVAQAQVPYVLTHPRSSSEAWTQHTDIMSEMLSFFAFRLDALHQAGVKDVLIDPGCGFGKTVEQNYHIIKHLHQLSVLNAPLLVGVSRKSMIYQPLGITPQEALNGTTAVHIWALEQGARVLRVHDVKEAKQAIRLWQIYQNN